MSTGELEYTDLPLTAYPVTSHILFVLFILFILLVLMNLINGLAVSDINEIQKKAEINSYKNQVEVIYHLESIFLIETSIKSKTSCVMNLLRRLGGLTLLIFPTCLKRHSIKLFPNRTSGKNYKINQLLRECFGCVSSVNWEICSCTKQHRFSLDTAHMEATMAVVMPRLTGPDKDGGPDLHKHIERLLKHLDAMEKTKSNE
ncbi:unnamed protein product [Meganyctiphanes norvegica]|uniref:Ion transport domain-containing protein n=1 Tax=Meganyctiphanes norvegica TaxID=48144 RepID=A0AAV2SE08_MEGNR